VPQPLVYVVVGAAILYGGWRFRAEIAATETRVLGVAVGALSASAMLDVLEQELHLAGLEEWLKLSGIAAMVVWSFTTAVSVLHEAETQAASDEGVGDELASRRRVAIRRSR
jgi:hypothetical protein